jgi:hypothetical protein
MLMNKLFGGSILLVAAFATLGCGTSAADDPLAGSWSNGVCYGSAAMPADVESCSVGLEFAGDLRMVVDAQWVSLAATEINPGCTTRRLVTGQQWSTNHGNDSVTFTGAAFATVERTGCVKPEDDLAAIETTDIETPAGTAFYGINGDTLTVTSGALYGTYAR